MTIREFKRGEWRGETYIFHLSTPKARKDHVCHCCSEQIARGERYVRYTTKGQEGPGLEEWTIHGECYEEDIPMFVGKRPSWRWGLSGKDRL